MVKPGIVITTTKQFQTKCCATYYDSLEESVMSVVLSPEFTEFERSKAALDNAIIQVDNRFNTGRFWKKGCKMMR